MPHDAIRRDLVTAGAGFGGERVPQRVKTQPLVGSNHLRPAVCGIHASMLRAVFVLVPRPPVFGDKHEFSPLVVFRLRPAVDRCL